MKTWFTLYYKLNENLIYAILQTEWKLDLRYTTNWMKTWLTLYFMLNENPWYSILQTERKLDLQNYKLIWQLNLHYTTD